MAGGGAAAAAPAAAVWRGGGERHPALDCVLAVLEGDEDGVVRLAAQALHRAGAAVGDDASGVD